MLEKNRKDILEEVKKSYPDKFADEERIFSQIHRGDSIFISTGCGEPQYLVNALVKYAESYPKAFFDAEVIHVWTLGVAPYTDEKFKKNFRHNSFFISTNTRKAVNEGLADYTPLFLSEIPACFRKGLLNIDVVLIQTSLPDHHGYMSLGISVDIVKAAIENSKLVIAQINANMPRIHGDTFIHIEQTDFLVHHDEPILEYPIDEPDETSDKIGKYVSKIVQDGDTIQVGYGTIPNAVLSNLTEKKNLGVHTELFSEGLVNLIRLGVVNNSNKVLDRGKTVASFCMGSKDTYNFLHDNPNISFRTIDYTNNPMIIGSQNNMVAINSALEIDLTGQSSAVSLGKTFFSGIGGHADFMRGANFSPGGKTILTMRSTSNKGKISRIVPFLGEGSGTSLIRGDIHYVVTEYGIAYLHTKNIRERAMALIAIAHPKFRPWLIEKAKENKLIYKDQAFIPGAKGQYPEHLETYRTSKKGDKILLRPVKISDEELLKDFFYSLSDKSVYRRFISTRTDMHHDRLQEFVVLDYSKDLVMLAILEKDEMEVVTGLSQYSIDEKSHTANIAVVVSDAFQGMGIGRLLMEYLTNLAKREGLQGFTAEVLVENHPMMRLLESMGFIMHKTMESGTYEISMKFP